MTPEEEYRLLREAKADIEAAAEDSYDKLIKLIRAGQEPKDAVRQVTDEFNLVYVAILAAALYAITGGAQGSTTAATAASTATAIGSIPATGETAAAAAASSDLDVGDIKLSTRLYSNAEATSAVVQSVVEKHTRGFQDARALALELYEGYGFNPEEVLNIDKTNDAIPRYMREALLDSPEVKAKLARDYAKAQTKALRTGALKAAYTELLDALDKTEAGVGADYLDKKIKVAFQEKLRYFATRIAQTELHRAYAIEQAKEYFLDGDVDFVKWELSITHPVEDICDYFAGVDRGYGPGVYPVNEAPVAPAHPYCQCVLSPEFFPQGSAVDDLTKAEMEYFNSLPPDQQRKVAGSAKKLERIKAGESAWTVHNSKTDPVYQVKTVGEINGV